MLRAAPRPLQGDRAIQHHFFSARSHMAPASGTPDARIGRYSLNSISQVGSLRILVTFSEFKTLSPEGSFAHYLSIHFESSECHTTRKQIVYRVARMNKRSALARTHLTGFFSS